MQVHHIDMMRRTTKARVIGECSRSQGACVLVPRDTQSPRNCSHGHDESDRPEPGPDCRDSASVEIDTDRLVSVLSEELVSRVPNAL